jgi:hypothetical protein
MKIRVLALIAGAALVAMIPSTALAVSAVDQSMTNTNNDWLDLGLQAQTFTVGQTGTLDAVDLYSYMNSGNGTLFVQIEALDGSGFPDGTVLSSGSAATDAVSTFHNVAVSNLAVTAGQHYAIVFWATDLTTQYNTFGSTTDQYAGGQALMYESLSWQNVSGSSLIDWGFRTYVDPAAPTTAPTTGPTSAPTARPTAAPTAAPTVPPTSTAGSSSPNGPNPPIMWLLPLGIVVVATTWFLLLERGRRHVR